jgi:hypothetical protein
MAWWCGRRRGGKTTGTAVVTDVDTNKSAKLLSLFELSYRDDVFSRSERGNQNRFGMCV